ncbi:hypothetical protein IC614_06725 [Allosphingosinicella flava]|uniref:Uncharacterized protein n=1 Tax=Allosphingosinicella flava TaxID=2771430 RepID=A0A7T2GHS5_9SPHN|nr:hypothetical protein [Sphingosinicella flava]QPQ54066.1 hypothetical protein IC614_06725 [Sphingosinicella flava]
MKRVKDMDGTQRVRIGLTGLAFVFVLVLLAAVFTRASDEAPITANSLDPALSESPSTTDPKSGVIKEEPNEPLAELGVAPGNADSNDADSQPK